MITFPQLTLRIQSSFEPFGRGLPLSFHYLKLVLYHLGLQADAFGMVNIQGRAKLVSIVLFLKYRNNLVHSPIVAELHPELAQ